MKGGYGKKVGLREWDFNGKGIVDKAQEGLDPLVQQNPAQCRSGVGRKKTGALRKILCSLKPRTIQGPVWNPM